MLRGARWGLRIAVLGLVVTRGGQLSAEDWTQFLGANCTATSTSSSIPHQWAPSMNVKWQIELPGYGSSSPIVVGDKVLVTCYSGFGLNPEAPGNAGDLVRHLICLDRHTGKQLWETKVASQHDEDPYEGFIREHGYASSTPATDGERLFVLFGKTGLFAFDLNGNQLWSKNLGTMTDPAKWGDGSSPILYDDLVIVNAGNVGRALVALKQSDGSEVWRIDDEGFGNCWSTPILVQLAERTELVFNVPGKIMGINPSNGEVYWTAASPVQQTVCASLTQHDGVVFAMGGRGGQAAAIRCGGNGDVSESHTVWIKPLRAGIGTPLTTHGLLVWHTGGIAYAADPQTGDEVFRERLPQPAAGESPARGPAGDYASAVVAGNKIILLTRKGTATILEAGREFKVLGQGSFGDDPGPFNATPAISDNQVFVRSNKAIYCIAGQ